MTCSAGAGRSTLASSPSITRFWRAPKPAEIHGLIGEAARQLGSVDILVNNAGIQRYSPSETLTEVDYDGVMAVNLKGAASLGISLSDVFVARANEVRE